MNPNWKLPPGSCGRKYFYVVLVTRIRIRVDGAKYADRVNQRIRLSAAQATKKKKNIPKHHGPGILNNKTPKFRRNYCIRSVVRKYMARCDMQNEQTGFRSRSKPACLAGIVLPMC